MIWFFVIFTLFSFSKTQLPHYILNACVPLLIVMATTSKLGQGHRWYQTFPLIFITIFMFLPEILTYAQTVTPAYDGANLARWPEAIPNHYRLFAILLFILVVVISFVPKLQAWQRLVITGVCFNVFMFTVLVKFIWGVQQAPLHQVMDNLEAYYPNQTVHTYRMHMPSFSVYRQQITPLTAPQSQGALCVVRVDRLSKLEQAVAPLQVETLFQSGGLLLTQLHQAK